MFLFKTIEKYMLVFTVVYAAHFDTVHASAPNCSTKVDMLNLVTHRTLLKNGT